MNNEPIFFKTLLLKGEAGGTIDRIEKTATVGTTDTYTIYLNDGSTTTFNVTNGTSIASIEYTSSSGNVDTYTVTLTDGSTTTFNVTNGEDFTVPTDGVIYYDGTDVPDGYEETSAPSGSGAYATIDDSSVSVATTYSSAKIEQLINGGLDYSTTEQNTGSKWLDGKPIYFNTLVDISNNTKVSLSSLNIDTLIKYDGSWVNTISDTPYVRNLDSYSADYGWSNVMFDPSNSTISLNMQVDGNYTSSKINLYYTKTTDTV